MARSSMMLFTLLAAASVFPICIEASIFGSTHHHQIGFLPETSKSLGDACKLGGEIPDGFVPVALNAASLMGTADVSDLHLCSMCVHIEARAALSGHDTAGAVGSYFGYVYDSCPDCADDHIALRLGIHGEGISSAKVTPIACPVAEDVPSLRSLRLHFDASNTSYARFQVRGSSAPVRSIRDLNSGRLLRKQGAFFVLTSTLVLPLRLEVDTDLDGRFRVHSEVMREYGDVGVEHFLVKVVEAPRPLRKQPNLHQVLDPVAVGVGNGSTASLSGAMARTVITTTRPDLTQIITVLESDATTVFDLRPRIG